MIDIYHAHRRRTNGNNKLSEPLFDAMDADWLTSRNELSAAGPNQLRIRRGRFMNESISEDSPIRSLPDIEADASISAEDDDDDEDDCSDKVLIVPVNLYSTEACKLLGFDENTANILFQIWINMDPQEREDSRGFFQMTQDWLKSRDTDAFGTNEDWDQALRSLGISDQLRRAILKPGFDEVRFTQSALEWVQHSMSVRWEALEEGYDVSRERARKLNAIRP